MNFYTQDPAGARLNTDSDHSTYLAPHSPTPPSALTNEPWWQLANTGELPTPATYVAPASYVVGDQWLALLEQATPTWFARLHLGVARYHHGDHMAPAPRGNNPAH